MHKHIPEVESSQSQQFTPKKGHQDLSQCFQSTGKKGRSALMKQSWTNHEDILLLRNVKKFGAKHWNIISKHIPHRTGKQCRERYFNHLKSGINNKGWSDYEEWILFLYIMRYGKKWSVISKHLTGRTDNNVKNHWNCKMKKKIFQCSIRYEQIKSQYFSNNLSNFEALSIRQQGILQQCFNQKSQYQMIQASDLIKPLKTPIQTDESFGTVQKSRYLKKSIPILEQNSENFVSEAEEILKWFAIDCVIRNEVKMVEQQFEKLSPQHFLI